MREILGIPGHYDPLAYVTLGYHNTEPKPHPRKRAGKELVSYNKFGFKEKSPKMDVRKKGRGVARNVYVRLPTGLKKKLKKVEEKAEVKFNNE